MRMRTSRIWMWMGRSCFLWDIMLVDVAISLYVYLLWIGCCFRARTSRKEGGCERKMNSLRVGCARGTCHIHRRDPFLLASMYEILRALAHPSRSQDDLFISLYLSGAHDNRFGTGILSSTCQGISRVNPKYVFYRGSEARIRACTCSESASHYGRNEQTKETNKRKKFRWWRTC